jgi:integrase
MFVPCLVFEDGRARESGRISLGHPWLDAYLVFVTARARWNTVLAVAYDLKVAFVFFGKPPEQVGVRDVLSFIEVQRAPRRGENVVRFADGESGLSARTIIWRLASLPGLFAYLLACDLVAANPVPAGLSARRPGMRGVPLIRTPRTLPRILEPSEANRLLAALRTGRDAAIVELMLFGALRRCEVLGLRLADLKPGENRVFIASGKGGHQRIVPVAPRVFTTLGRYLEHDRPQNPDTEALFLVLKGPRRGQPLSAAGLDEILNGARERAGLVHATCHELRHTCLTRLREAGMALEAVQAQAGHASIETTRIYLHLSNGWLAEEYRRAMDILDGLAEPGDAR